MGLWETFRTIRTASERHLPDAADTAGDEGERLALDVVQQLAGDRQAACRLYPSLRVPRHDAPGKYEIDLLIATPPGLLGLEVKNWGGTIEEARNGHWQQVPSRGEARDHDDPLASVAAKMAAVGAYLSANGVPVSPQALASAVVLTNPRLVLGPQLVGRPHLVRLAALRSLVAPMLPANREGFWSPLKRLFGLEKMPVPVLAQFADVTRVLDRLPTWDLVYLHGGRVVKGDILGPALVLASGKTLGRTDAVALQLHMPRSWWLGWFVTSAASWADAGGICHREPVKLGQTIGIRLAGRGEEVHVPVEHVERIHFGWRDESYYRAAKPALDTYQPGMTFAGTVTAVQDFGIFVNLDGHRDGLVPVSRLRRRQRSPGDYRKGEQVGVRVVKTEIRKGKETIELDLQ
jgi:hypothetical protein